MRAATSARSRGFSLIEMAVVLFIVVLLLGSLLVPFATQVEQRRIAETQKTMEEIKEALIGFAIQQGRLPCPAISATDGHEQSPCSTQSGFVPWATLGVSKLDAWGHLFRYAVSPAFSSQANPIRFDSAPTLTIKTRDAAGSLVNVTDLSSVPVVLLSYGPNGYGATNDDGSTAAPVPAQNLDEANNAQPAPNAYITRPPKKAQVGCNDNGSPACEFDDIVGWLSPYVLFNRMVAAGRLP
ncbi:type II secretion system protein [Thiobacter aerophilum]|uniref:Prepilin-type N-terminal cleavage/methylation domain-containing protein n=1 Tax=Thiobacter aerophilum TaxID=3121275 RepID=A0ABV0EDZ9_9BURK